MKPTEKELDIIKITQPQIEVHSRAVIVWIAANPVVVVSRTLFDIRLAIIDSRARWEIALETFEQSRGTNCKLEREEMSFIKIWPVLSNSQSLLDLS